MLSGAGFSLWGLGLARTKPNRLKPAPLTLCPAKEKRTIRETDIHSNSKFLFIKDCAMKKDAARNCHHGLSRRTILQGGLAAAVTSVSGVSGVSEALLAEPAAPSALKKTGERAIDIHAHYFPQTYF